MRLRFFNGLLLTGVICLKWMCITMHTDRCYPSLRRLSITGQYKWRIRPEASPPKVSHLTICSTLPGIASFPGLLQLQFLIACSMQNGGRRPGESYHTICGCQISSHLISTAKWCTRLILHSVLATKMGQAPAESYTECMKHPPG